MKTTTRMAVAFAAATLLAAVAGAQLIAVSEAAVLDTRSFTTDWSEARWLNTKQIVGTMLLLR